MDSEFESIIDYINISDMFSVNGSVDSELRVTSSLDVGVILLIIAYSAIVVISLFGNSLVCHVIFKNKRMYTVTNLFIANLAISDLLVTLLNIPINIVRNLMDNWPFGKSICHLTNVSLMVSVYVSTFTLTGIALDRHKVLLYPLSPRMTRPAACVWLAVIWLVSVCLSLPFGIFIKVTKVDLILRQPTRCQSAYPEPSDKWEQYITVVTFVLQYIIPLFIIAIAYGRIVHKLWTRTHLGAVTEDQQISQARAKKKSIKMLITVVIVFAMCWMPLNLYHLLTDLHPDTKKFTHDRNAFFVCHCIAISSTCYNPFVYCWLNETFRSEAKARFECLFPGAKRVHPGPEGDGVMSCSECGTARRWNKPPMSNTRSTTIGSLRRNCRHKSEPSVLDREETEQMLREPLSLNTTSLTMWSNSHTSIYTDDENKLFEKPETEESAITQF